MFDFVVIGSIPHDITCAASDSEFIYFGTEKATIIKMNYSLVNGEKMTEDEIRNKIQIQGELKIPKVDKKIEKIICYPSYYLLVFLCNNTIYYADTRRITRSRQTELPSVVETSIRNAHALFSFFPSIEPVFIKRQANFDSIQSTGAPDLKKIILDSEYQVYSAYDKRLPLSQYVDRDPTHLPNQSPETITEDPFPGIIPKFGVLTNDNNMDFYQLIGVQTSLLKTKRYTEKYTNRRETPGPLELSEFKHFSAIKIDLSKKNGVVDKSQILWFGDCIVFTAIESGDFGSSPALVTSNSPIVSGVQEQSITQAKAPVRAYEYVRIPEQMEVKKKHDTSVSRIVLNPEVIITFESTTTPIIFFLPNTGIPASDRLKYYTDIKNRFDYMKGKDLEITDNSEGWYAGIRRSFALRFDDDTILPYKFENKKVVSASGVITLTGSSTLLATRKDSIIYISEHTIEEGDGNEKKNVQECRFISLTTPEEKKQDSCLPTTLLESLKPSFIYTDIHCSQCGKRSSAGGQTSTQQQQQSTTAVVSSNNLNTGSPGAPVSVNESTNASVPEVNTMTNSEAGDGKEMIAAALTSTIPTTSNDSSIVGIGQMSNDVLLDARSQVLKDSYLAAHTDIVLNSSRPQKTKRTREMRVNELSVPPNTPFGFIYDKTNKLVLMIVKASVYRQINSILETTESISSKITNENSSISTRRLSNSDMNSLITSIEECEQAFSMAIERNWISETARETMEIRHKIGLRLYDTQLYEKFFGHMLTVFNQLDVIAMYEAERENRAENPFLMTDNFIRSVFAHYSFGDFMKALDVNYKYPPYLPITRWWDRYPTLSALAASAPAFHLPSDILKAPIVTAKGQTLRSLNYENPNITFGDIYPVDEIFASSPLYTNFQPPPEQSWSHLKQLLFWLFQTLADPKGRDRERTVRKEGDKASEKHRMIISVPTPSDDITLLYVFGQIVSGTSREEVEEYVRTLNISDVRLLLGTKLFRLAGKITMTSDLGRALGYMALARPLNDEDETYYELLSAMKTASANSCSLTPSMNDVKKRLEPITSLAPSFGGLRDILHMLSILAPELSKASPLNLTNKQLCSFYNDMSDSTFGTGSIRKTSDMCNDVILCVIQYLPYISIAQSFTNEIKEAKEISTNSLTLSTSSFQSSLAISSQGKQNGDGISNDSIDGTTIRNSIESTQAEGVVYTGSSKELNQIVSMENILEGPKAKPFSTLLMKRERRQMLSQSKDSSDLSSAKKIHNIKIPNIQGLCKGIRLGTISGVIFSLRPEYVHELFKNSIQGDKNIVRGIEPLTKQELLNLISMVVLTIKISLDDTIHKGSGSPMERFLLSNIPYWNSEEAAKLLVDILRALSRTIGSYNEINKIMGISGRSVGISSGNFNGEAIGGDDDNESYFETYKISLEADIEEIYIRTRIQYQEKLNVETIKEQIKARESKKSENLFEEKENNEIGDDKSLISLPEYSMYFSPFLPVFILFNLIFKHDFKACVEAILGEYRLSKDHDIRPDDLMTKTIEDEEAQKLLNMDDYLFTNLKQSRHYKTVKLPQSLYLKAIGDYIYELIVALAVDELRHEKKTQMRIQDAKKIKNWLKGSSSGSSMFSNIRKNNDSKSNNNNSKNDSSNDLDRTIDSQDFRGTEIKKGPITLTINQSLKVHVTSPASRIEGHYSREQQAIRSSEFFRITHMIDESGLENTSSLSLSIGTNGPEKNKQGELTNREIDVDLLSRMTEYSCGWKHLCTTLGLLDAMASEAKISENSNNRENEDCDTKGNKESDLDGCDDNEKIDSQYKRAIYNNDSHSDTIHPVLPVPILHSLEALLLRKDLKSMQFIAVGDIPKMLQLISDDFPVLALEESLRILGELQAAQCGRAEIKKNILDGMQHVAAVEREKRKSSLYTVMNSSTRCAICGAPFEVMQLPTILDGEIVHMSCYDALPEFQ